MFFYITIQMEKETNGDKCYQYIKTKVGDKYVSTKPKHMKWCDYYVNIINLLAKVKMDNKNLVNGKVENVIELFREPQYVLDILSDYSYRFLWNEYLNNNVLNLDIRHIAVNFEKLLDYALKKSKSYIVESLLNNGISTSQKAIVSAMSFGTLDILKILYKYNYQPSQSVLRWIALTGNNESLAKLRFIFDKTNMLPGERTLYMAFQRNLENVVIFLARHLPYDIYELFGYLNLSDRISPKMLRFFINIHGHETILAVYYSTFKNTLESYYDDDADFDNIVNMLNHMPIFSAALGVNILDKLFPYYDGNAESEDRDERTDLIKALLDTMIYMIYWENFHDLQILAGYGILPELSMAYELYNKLLENQTHRNIMNWLNDIYGGLFEKLRYEIGKTDLEEVYMNPRLTSVTFRDILEYEKYYMFAPTFGEFENLTNRIQHFEDFEGKLVEYYPIDESIYDIMREYIINNREI